MRTVSCVAFLLLVSPALLHADNWPAWRGPHADGVAPAGDYPIEWDETKNVRWKAPLPGVGASTPAVWDDRIFLTSGDAGENAVLCFNRDGKQLWKTHVHDERPGKNGKASGSNPSPVTDGKHVFVYYKSGDFACLDFDGKIVWQKNLQKLYGEDTLWWDLGTSPVLTSKHVVIACMHSGPSYLAAFEKDDGKVAWKVDRNLGAPREAAQSYTTPVVTTYEGREMIVVCGADHVTCHDASNGKEIWRVSGMNPSNNNFFRSISSPAVLGDLVVAPYARGANVYGIKLGGSGDVTKSHVAWISKESGADVPTPIVKDGKIYICKDRGALECLDAKTGKKVFSVATAKGRGKISASPVLVGDRIYVIRENGTASVVQLGKEPKLIATNLIRELTVATPVFVDGEILIRTDKNLYCISSAR
jgi:outer membrane protein assembly factor BamB